jgi:hypothetical protein
MAWIPKRPWQWRLRSKLGRMREIFDGEPDGYSVYVNGQLLGAQPSHGAATLLAHRAKGNVEIKPYWHKQQSDIGVEPK